MKWSIESMECYPEKSNQTDVVFKVHWDLTETEGAYYGRVYSAVVLQLDPNSPFTPYDQLTEEQVVGWVKTALGPVQVAKYEEAVAQQIKNQKNPPVVTPPLPW